MSSAAAKSSGMIRFCIVSSCESQINIWSVSKRPSRSLLITLYLIIPFYRVKAISRPIFLLQIAKMQRDKKPVLFTALALFGAAPRHSSALDPLVMWIFEMGTDWKGEMVKCWPIQRRQHAAFQRKTLGNREVHHCDWFYLFPMLRGRPLSRTL